MLYVEFDDNGRCIVSRDDPDPLGLEERADYDGVVAIVRTAGPAGSPDAPDMTAVRLYTGALMAIVAGGTIAGSVLIHPALGVPAGILATLYVARRHNQTRARLEQRWSGRHRVLDTRPEVSRFRRAFDAARTILVAWPFLADLVQIPSPRAEVTAALWNIAGLLRDHADLGEQFAALNDPRFGALPAEASVRATLDDRLLRVDAGRRALSADIDRRIETLTNLAARCASFVRAEAALNTAYEAVRRADESLRRLAPDATFDTPDHARDLAERTAAILGAYRDLTLYRAQ
ncbi:MAG TPA: hypothetical protein VL738_33800 [Dactylosporangium sp.]|nr:hypothetical protein [Dactylosporangium sp.]